MAKVYIKTFEEVRQDMDQAYNDYLKTGDEELLWTLAHQVLSNALFVLNEDEIEDVFTYEFQTKHKVITALLNTGVGHISKVSTIPSYGTVWFTTDDGQEYNDDAQELAVWEIYNIAVALYMMTEPLAQILYK